MWVRVGRSFGHAWAGVVHVAYTQPNWRIHLAAALAVMAAAVALGVPTGELSILALTVGLVLVAEAVNTAIERAVDAQGGPLSIAGKHAKDAAAGAVLLSAITAVVVGALIFGPRILLLGRQA